jgi:hypothetical protein
MAIKEIRRTNNGLGEMLSDFVCDNIADIVNMPDVTDGVAIGSTLICAENKKTYILSVAGTWLEF